MTPEIGRTRQNRAISSPPRREARAAPAAVSAPRLTRTWSSTIRTVLSSTSPAIIVFGASVWVRIHSGMTVR